jgi:prophage DNA circulation protein
LVVLLDIAKRLAEVTERKVSVDGEQGNAESLRASLEKLRVRAAEAAGLIARA